MGVSEAITGCRTGRNLPTHGCPGQPAWCCHLHMGTVWIGHSSREGAQAWRPLEEEPKVCPSGKDAPCCIQSHEFTQGARNGDEPQQWEQALTVLDVLSLLLKLYVNPPDSRTGMTPVLKMGTLRSRDLLEATKAGEPDSPG